MSDTMSLPDPFNLDCLDEPVCVFPITQATAAVFSDLFIRLTFLCFIQVGAKKVICPINGEMVGEAGDVMIFPSGSIVTLENRPQLDASYRADGVYFTHDLIDRVFAGQGRANEPCGIQIIRKLPHHPSEILRLIKDTLGDPALPLPIRQHRLLEPLIWLRHQGIRLPVQDAHEPLARLRRLIETDLSRPWRAAEVARHFAMSESSFRRWLARSGYGFARILHNTRLEKGLALLQSTMMPISQIALDCGFTTPSHFSDAFKKRFGIQPKEIRSTEE